MNDISTTTCKYNAEVKKVGYTDLGNIHTQHVRGKWACEKPCTPELAD